MRLEKLQSVLGKKETREADALKAGPPLGLKRNKIRRRSNYCPLPCRQDNFKSGKSHHALCTGALLVHGIATFSYRDPGAASTAPAIERPRARADVCSQPQLARIRDALSSVASLTANDVGLCV